ncbi:MAG: hypothetical protein PQJ59_00135 [Spirochaetales bacterium]|nr:hypothetical protein [Spirochaetales bacterium]
MGKRSRFIKRFLPVLGLVFFCQFILVAQETIREPNVLVYHSLLMGEENASFKIELEDHLSSALAGEHFNAILMDGETGVTELIGSALWMGAFFIIEILESRSDDNCHILLRAYSSWDGALIGEEAYLLPSHAMPDDLALGEIIIPIMTDHLHSEEARDLARQLGEGISLSRELASEPEPSREESSEKNHFVFLLDLGGHISTFESADYFKTAITPAFRCLFRQYDSRFSLFYGGVVRFTGFTAEGDNRESSGALWSLGAEVGIESPPSGRFRYFTRMSGGASYLTMETETDGTLGKFLPSLSCGMGASLSFTDNLSGILALDYALFAEESVLLTGFIPSLGISYFLNNDK